jgi:hypothetical protein
VTLKTDKESFLKGRNRVEVKRLRNFRNIVGLPSNMRLFRPHVTFRLCAGFNSLRLIQERHSSFLFSDWAQWADIFQ